MSSGGNNGTHREVAASSDTQALRVTPEVTQRLESEIQAAAMSTATTGDVNMCSVVEGVRQDVQAQLEQNRADTLRREEETQTTWIRLQNSCRN